MILVQHGTRFEWDDNKEKINIRKHGIDFETAIQVFKDKERIEEFDKLHSDYEERYITIGMLSSVALIVSVVYTERDKTLRIISARKATNREMRLYYDN